MNTEDRIEYPPQQEMDKSICFIVEQGIGKNRSLIREISDALSLIGFRNLFFGMRDVLALSAVCSAAAYTSVWTAVSIRIPVLTACLFFAAPVLFLSYSIFSFLQDHWENVLPLKNVRKYRAHTVSCLQMMIVSLLSLFLLTGFSAALGRMTECNALTLMKLSYISLLLFSAGSMQCEKMKSVYRVLIMPGIWTAGVIVCVLVPVRFCALLEQTADHLGVFLIPLLMWISYRQIKRMLCSDSCGGTYAFD